MRIKCYYGISTSLKHFMRAMNMWVSVCFLIALLACVNCGTIQLVGCVVIHPTTYDYYWANMATHLSCSGGVNFNLDIPVGVVNGTNTPIMSTTYLPQCTVGVVYAFSVLGEMEWGYEGSSDILITGAIVTVDYITPGNYNAGVNLMYYDHLVKDTVQLGLVYYD